MTASLLSEKRVLVTGGSGFIGGHLVRRLAASGVQTFATRRASPAGEGLVEWLHLDLAEPDSIREAVRVARPHVVFHLAARLGSDRSLEFSERALQENFFATHALLAAVIDQASSLSRFVLAGSAEEYGRAETLPVSEDQPLGPVSPYSVSKAAATQLALAYGELYEVPVSVVRPFIVYGPGQSAGMMLPSLIETLLEGRDFAMTGGEQTRDFLHIDDLIDGLLAAAVSDGAAGEVFNLCSGEERPIRQVAELARSLMQSAGSLLIGALPYRQNEVWRLFGSNEKARRLLQWSPQISLERGLGETVEWYEMQRVARS